MEGAFLRTSSMLILEREKRFCRRDENEMKVMEVVKRAVRKLKSGKAGGMQHTSRNGEGGKLYHDAMIKGSLRCGLEMWNNAY